MGSAAREQCYDFHGLRLSVCAEPVVTEALDARLGRFTRAGAGACDVRFDYRSVDGAGLDADSADWSTARPVYDSPMGQALYDEDRDRMLIRCTWPLRAACDPVSGQTTISIAGAVGEHLWALSHPLLTLPLIETLKRRGLFSVHAGSVALGGKGLLIPAASGSGKSTLALALARAGFGFMGDDLVFLGERAGGLRAHAFPEAFDLTDDSVRLFPELADVLARDKLPGWPKHQLRVEERFGAAIVWQCRPAVLVFPRVAHRAQSRVAPMDGGEALHELLPNILLTAPESSQQHLDMLGQLVASCTCYRLETGTDFDALAAQLRELLEAA